MEKEERQKEACTDTDAQSVNLSEIENPMKVRRATAKPPTAAASSDILSPSRSRDDRGATPTIVEAPKMIKHRRPRAATACEHCRACKVKCDIDKEVPCANCKQRAIKCIVTRRWNRRRPPLQTNTNSTGTEVNSTPPDPSQVKSGNADTTNKGNAFLETRQNLAQDASADPLNWKDMYSASVYVDFSENLDRGISHEHVLPLTFHQPSDLGQDLELGQLLARPINYEATDYDIGSNPDIPCPSQTPLSPDEGTYKQAGSEIDMRLWPHYRLTQNPSLPNNAPGRSEDVQHSSKVSFSRSHLQRSLLALTLECTRANISMNEYSAHVLDKAQKKSPSESQPVGSVGSSLSRLFFWETLHQTQATLRQSLAAVNMVQQNLSLLKDTVLTAPTSLRPQRRRYDKSRFVDPTTPPTDKASLIEVPVITKEPFFVDSETKQHPRSIIEEGEGLGVFDQWANFIAV
ncbi:hypothetical protein B0J13DRAFT_528523 [Dactylonectria estremocensis]|uniref:Zn(2)-C6 fungal-type domain-containing protein n=1 Tax=Dactylonectria estremocensis TaxID=1079267 RepID=A0A9P9EI13_9HYPO|nr:hypothetical protein B0J13DRAFT_528523 [Dactylonectria estremocensis]